MKFDLLNIKLSKNDIKRGLILPTQSSKELAEFLGILTGDGYLNFYSDQYKYLIEIYGDSRLDKNYLESYVTSLVKKLFNLVATTHKKKDQNSLCLRLISKGLVNYLVYVGFKKGRKEQIGIPNWINSSRNYMFSFIKGLADTDCSIHYRKDYPIISFTSKSEVLVSEVFNFLKQEGFLTKNYYKETRHDVRFKSPSIVYRLRLNGRENLRLWFKYIYFRNKRHLIKIKKWDLRNLNPRFRRMHLSLHPSPT
jgi:hypothetical protein